MSVLKSKDFAGPRLYGCGATRTTQSCSQAAGILRVIYYLAGILCVISVVFPFCIGMYWNTTQAIDKQIHSISSITYQSNHYVLVCILFVFEVRLFVLKILIFGFDLEYMLNTDKIKTEVSGIRSYWVANTRKILANTNSGLSNTDQNKIQYKLICTNTVQYTPIYRE